MGRGRLRAGLASLLLTTGTLADRFGHRRVFVYGLVGFTIASILCGLATSPTLLLLARGFQGIGGAAMFATSLSLIAQAFSGPDRGTAFGIWGATIGARGRDRAARRRRADRADQLAGDLLRQRADRDRRASRWR